MVASVVCRPSTSSKDFSSETTGSITIIIVHMQPPGNGGKERLYIWSGSQTKKATMHICGKNLKISSSPEPMG